MFKKECIFLVLVLFTAQLFAVQDPNLLAWYRFNETSGTTATDYSGNANNGTVGSSSGWNTTGFNGKGCLYFNGTFNVTVPSAVYSNIDQTATVSLWVNSDDPGTYSNALFYGLDINGVRTLGVELPGGEGLHLYYNAGSSGANYDCYPYWQIANEVDFRGNWNHFAFTKDAGSGLMKIYINGSLLGTASGKTMPMNATTSFVIGSTPTNTWQFKGKMADFRIYNRALGSTEIADLADTNLLAWWTFNEGTGSIAYDATINRNDGTKGTANTWITDGLSFSGNSDSGITFANNGLNIVSNLTNQASISYVATWPENAVTHGNFPYDGRDSSDVRLLTAECPTGTNILLRNGGDMMWGWEAFSDEDTRFIYGRVNKTWGDEVRITSTADFSTGVFKLYVDNYLYLTETGKTGSFANLVKFTIGKSNLGDNQMEGSMKDFRIYDKVLSESEIAV